MLCSATSWYVYSFSDILTLWLGRALGGRNLIGEASSGLFAVQDGGFGVSTAKECWLRRREELGEGSSYLED